MKATVTIRNHIDKKELLENFSDEMIDEIRERIQRRAKQLVPVDTGKLQASIRLIQRYTVGSTVRYAGYVENGTRFMRAQPYMEPAIEDVMRTLPSIQRQAFRDASRRSKA
jgi:HK97 gp10 family phage protein